MLEKGSNFRNTIDPALILFEKPKNLVADVFSGKAHLSWGATSYADSYVVYISNSANFSIENNEYEKEIEVENTNLLIDLDKFSVNTLYFRVVAKNDFREGSIPSDVAYIVNDKGTVSGFVSDEATGNPLVGARVILNIPGHKIGTVTNENGYYVIKVPADIDYSVILVSAEDYLSASVEISKLEIFQSEYLKKDTALTKVDLSVVPVLGGENLYHLGDDQYGGAVNSQFQKKTMGTSLELTFNLNDEQIEQFSNIRLNMRLKGSQRENRLYVNGNYIWRMNVNLSPLNGSYGNVSWTYDLNRDAFQSGSNALMIQSNQVLGYFIDDYDDFEFTDIHFTLEK